MPAHLPEPPAAPPERHPLRAAPAPAAEVIDALDLLAVLGRRRRRLALWPLVAALLAAGLALVLPETYTGVVRVMPPQQQPQAGSAALLSQLGGLAGAAGGALGLKSPADLYLGLLRSEAVAGGLVERFGLKEAYGARFEVDARRELAGRTRLEAEKSGLLVIEVEADTPARAAALANGYVEELQRLLGSLAVSEASQRRLFFERQLGQSKAALGEAEAALRRAIEAGGLVSVEAQGRGAVETVARLRAQLSAKEIQLGAMRAYATSAHPDVRRGEQELQSMRAELLRLESGAGEAAPKGGASGGSGVANLGLVREVKYQEVLFELMARQYELARVDESKEAPLLQVVDPARPPEKRTRPKRTLLVLSALVAGLLAAVVVTFAEDALASAAADPARREKLAAARAAWGRRAPPKA